MKRIYLFTSVLFLSLNTFSQQYSTLTVEGKAIVKQVPENILITIEVSSKDIDYSTCVDKLIKSSIDLHKDLLVHGIDSNIIKTSDFKIAEDIDYQSGDRVKVGYQGLIELSIESEFSNKLISNVMTIIKSGHYNFNLSVRFILSESQKQELINSAIKNSISDAVEKAGIIAKAANIELVKIKSITYDNEFRFYDYDSEMFNRVRYVAPRIAQGGGTAEFELNQKELAVEKFVTIEWITKSK